MRNAVRKGGCEAQRDEQAANGRSCEQARSAPPFSRSTAFARTGSHSAESVTVGGAEGGGPALVDEEEALKGVSGLAQACGARSE